MFLLRYLICFFNIYYSSKTVDEQHKHKQASIDQLEQKPEIKNKLIQETPRLSKNNSNLKKFLKAVFSGIYNIIFSPIKIIFNWIKKNFIGLKIQIKEEPKIQEKKDLPEDIQDSRENYTQGKQVNSVDSSSTTPNNPKTNQIPFVDNPSIAQNSVGFSSSISQEPISEKNPISVHDNTLVEKVKQEMDNPVSSNIPSDEIQLKNLESLDPHDTQGKQVNSVDSSSTTPNNPKTEQVSLIRKMNYKPKLQEELNSWKNLKIAEDCGKSFKNAKQGDELYRYVLSTGKTLICKKSKISQENNTEGLEIDFGILDLKFGADIIDINHLNDEVKKFKTLLDFIMASIAKNDIDEFRLIIDLNDQKVFVNPFRYYVSGYNLQSRRQYLSSSKSLTKKFEDLLKGEKSIFEFLYYTNCNAEESSLENTIWIGGCRSTGLNPFKILIMAFDYETKNSSSSDRKFKKDIMEMWFDWNDAQKHNYCYGIWKAFYDMRLKKCPGFNLKCNRGIKYGNQVEELNHLHVDNPSFRDQFKSLKKELYLNESIFSSEDQ